MKPFHTSPKRGASAIVLTFALASVAFGQQLGQEISVPTHLQDGDEYTVPLSTLLSHGKRLFDANWTLQEGGGRPLTKGTGAPVSNPANPLVFPRAFNRVSAQDANSCAGCHNAPYGLSGGGGDYVTGVFVLAQRFDYATFDGNDFIPLSGAVAENGQPTTLQGIGNFRATLGMFGSGYIELLAREMTADLQAIRNATLAGQTRALTSKGVGFGNIARDAAGNWITAGVEGLPDPSLATTGPNDPPSLVIRPFHQVGNVISIRQFTNNAFNHHHGIQPTERFGVNTDPDGDGFTNEMTRAEVTAASVFQAVMAPPGRVIPNDPIVEAAVLLGETKFEQIGCATCHRPALALNSPTFVEPNPYNPAGNLRPGDAPPFSVNLNTAAGLPRPRLKTSSGNVTLVRAFTDLKLHDICDGPNDPNRERINQNKPAGSTGFFAGNTRFLTRKLWGCANEPPYFHHGQFTTMRQAILAHSGEALASRQAFEGLSNDEKNGIIEFLKTLQVLKPGTQYLTVDENNHAKAWPPN